MGTIPDGNSMKTALLAGATGLIGSQLLQLLLESKRYSQVIAITRRSLPVHPKLVEVPINPSTFVELETTQWVDDVFCCLGTTMSKARSKDKFRLVDFTYPLLLAKNGFAHGATQFLLVSALGADKNAAIFYNQVKGEVEEAISGVGFDSVHIFRPSLLLGPREEKRSAEDAAKFFYKVFGFAIPAKYKAIESIKVARAMVHYASLSEKGKFIHESISLQRF